MRNALIVVGAIAVVAVAALLLMFLRSPARKSDPERKDPNVQSTADRGPSTDRVANATATATALGTAQLPITTSVRDKKVRDEVRNRILEAQKQVDRERERAAAAAPNMGPAPSASVARLTPEEIREVVREEFAPMARQCYAAALERNPKLAGKLTLSFVIQGNERIGGIVESAEADESSTIKDEGLVECMRESMLSVVFKAPRGGGMVTVKYPFALEPDEPDAAAPAK